MKVAKDLLYSNDHEWVKVEGDCAFIGISDFAQHQLGDIVYVELPEVDDELEKEDSFSAIESVKAAADVYMPVGGPYDNWIIKVTLSDKAELDALMTSEEYENFCAEEE